MNNAYFHEKNGKWSIDLNGTLEKGGTFSAFYLLVWFEVKVLFLHWTNSQRDISGDDECSASISVSCRIYGIDSFLHFLSVPLISQIHWRKKHLYLTQPLLRFKCSTMPFSLMFFIECGQGLGKCHFNYSVCFLGQNSITYSFFFQFIVDSTMYNAQAV